MGRLMGIDYGRRRCGIAVTDTLRIVATGLTTVATGALADYVKAYVAAESVDAIIVGYPRDMHGNDSESMRYIRPGLAKLRQAVPDTEIIMWDERFTSVLAHRGMLDGGMRKSRRRDKAAVDEMAAALILNSYLESRDYSDTSI